MIFLEEAPSRKKSQKMLLTSSKRAAASEVSPSSNNLLLSKVSTISSAWEPQFNPTHNLKLLLEASLMALPLFLNNNLNPSLRYPRQKQRSPSSFPT
jgi:hypothetical protein